MKGIILKKMPSTVLSTWKALSRMLACELTHILISLLVK